MALAAVPPGAFAGSAAAKPPESRPAALPLRVVDGLPPLQEPNRTALRTLLAHDHPHAAAPAREPEPADWGRILTEPAAVRGQPFALEGRFAGRQRPADAGGEAPLREWGLVVKGPGGEDLPVVLYLPPGEARPPAAGARIAGRARLLALWDDADASGEARRYPVLAAAGPIAVVAAPNAAPSAAQAAGWMPRLIALLVTLAGVTWWLGRRLRRPRGGPLGQLRAARDPRRGPPGTAPATAPAHAPSPADVSGQGPPPADPAEALRWLADRHAEGPPQP